MTELNARYERNWYYCWLIERRDGSVPRWLGAHSWVTDANEAIWYARRSDAEAIVAHDLKGVPKIVVCEHGFDTHEVLADMPANGKYFAQQCFHEGCQRRVMQAQITELERRLKNSRAAINEVAKIARERGEEPDAYKS